MKNSRIYLLPLLLITLMLTACATVPADNVPSDQAQTVEEQLSTPEQNVVQPGGGEAELPVLSIQSRYGQKMSCDLLADEAERASCFVRIQDLIGISLENEIMTTFDAGRCQLFPAEMAAECQKRIADTGVKGPLSPEDRAALQKALQPVMPEMPAEGETPDAVPPQPTFDSKLCQPLKAEGLRAYCEKTLAERIDQQKLSEIIASGEIARCDQLTQDTYREQCRQILEGPAAMPEPLPGVPMQPPVVPVEPVLPEA
jgi:hypothetical protein